jgi:predicted MFS family arabinose efflux permease
VALGLLPIGVAAPLAWRYLGERPIGDRSDATANTMTPQMPAAAVDPDGATLRQALQDQRFWFMTVGLFFCSGLLTAMVTNLVPLLQERGNSASTAAMIAAVFGAAVIVGRIAVGGLLDRFWAPMVGACLMFPAALAALALALLNPGVGACVLIVFIAGLAGGAEVDLMAFLTARYFGLREFGRIFAGVYISFALGPGVLVVLFGRLRDVSGSYQSGLLCSAAGIALFGVLLLCLGPYPDSSSQRADRD